MPTIPSSQTKKPHEQVELRKQIEAIQSRLQSQHLTLRGKVQKLRTLKSDDPIQQLQSDIISDLFDRVTYINDYLFPWLLGLPSL